MKYLTLTSLISILLFPNITTALQSDSFSAGSGCEVAGDFAAQEKLLKAGTALKNPPVVDFYSAKDPTKVVADLKVKYSNFTLAGCDTTLRSYTGPWQEEPNRPVGPTMLIKPGQLFSANITNELTPSNGHKTHGEQGKAFDSHGGESTIFGYIPPQGGMVNHNSLDPKHYNTTNLHTHGWHVSPTKNQDDIFAEIFPGSATYEQRVDLPKDHVAGTFWYHAHLHGSTALQVSSGMAGALLVKDTTKGLGKIPAIQAAKDYLMLFQQIAYDEKGKIEGYKNLQQIGYKGLNRPVFVNGMAYPTLDVKVNEVQRWRFVHAGLTDGIYPMIINANIMDNLKEISAASNTLNAATDTKNSIEKVRALIKTAEDAVSNLEDIPGAKSQTWQEHLMFASSKKTVDAITAEVKLVEQEVNTFFKTTLQPGSLSMYEIALDGLPTGFMPKLSYATLSPGYRVDVMAKFAGTKPNENYYLVDRNQLATQAPGKPNLRFILAQINIKSGEAKAHCLPNETSSGTQCKPSRKNQIAAAKEDYSKYPYNPESAEPYKHISPLANIPDEELTGKTQLVHYKAGNDYTCPEQGGMCTPCPNNNPNCAKPGDDAKEKTDVKEKTQVGSYMICDGKDGNNQWMCFNFNPSAGYARTLNLNSASKWRVSASANQNNHVFHIHVNPFQVQRKFIDPQYAELDIGHQWVWKDTLKTPADETNPAILKSRYTDYSGAFVQHCHVLNHEDQGMMQVVEVRPSDAHLLEILKLIEEQKGDGTKSASPTGLLEYMQEQLVDTTKHH